MSTWAIGDVQGCFEPLQRLLVAINFDPSSDRLVLLGDLVNRGPDSLAVLRWASSTAGVDAVLGNHDLHLLAAAAGVRELRSGDTLRPVLDAPDRNELLLWLSRRPVLLVESGFALVHAALHPSWSLAEAEQRARALESVLRGPDPGALLSNYYCAELGPLGSMASEAQQLSHSLAVFTRLRCVTEQGALSFDFTGPLEELPPGRTPWWRASAMQRSDLTVLFGHWAAIGVHSEPGICALDSGCVWGRKLSAYRLDDGRIIQVEGLSP